MIDTTDSVLIDRLCELYHEAQERAILPALPEGRRTWTSAPTWARELDRRVMIGFLDGLARNDQYHRMVKQRLDAAYEEGYDDSQEQNGTDPEECCCAAGDCNCECHSFPAS